MLDPLAKDFRECLCGDLGQRLQVSGRCVPCAIAEVRRGDQAAMDGFAPEMSVEVSCLRCDWMPRVGERVTYEDRVLRVTAVSGVAGDPVVTATLEPVQTRG